MPKLTIDDHKKRILDRLHEIGSRGASKSALKIKSRSLADKALKELESNHQIGNLGNQRNTRYVLMEHYRPFEIACEVIERNAKKIGKLKSGILSLVTRSELEKGASGKVLEKASDARNWLVQEKKLFRFKRGHIYYAHSEQLESFDDAPFDESTIMEAYHRLKENTGLSNVPIYDLHRESGVPLEPLKTFLRERSSRGEVVLSLGDWSLSGETLRSGVIEIRGHRYLLVRFNTPEAEEP